MYFDRMNFNKVKSAGITAVELVLVLGVVLLITGLIFVAVDPEAILAKSRDEQRIQDLDELNTALQFSLAEEEITLVDTKECENCTSATGSVSVNGSGWVKFTIRENKIGLSKYISQLPLDPLNLEPYVYKFTSDTENQKYKIAVPLESEDNSNRMKLDGGIDPDLYEVGTDLTL